MAAQVKAIPDGYQTITPNLTIKDAAKAIDFYKKAFNAQVLDLFPNLNGKGIMHATLKIGDSIFMMGDEMPGGMNFVRSLCLSDECIEGYAKSLLNRGGGV